MAREITAGVLLSLKDQFSSKIQGAGVSAQGFADKAIGAAEKVNKAFSGVAGTLGTLGVSLGAGMLAKASIDYEDAMVRIGTSAGMSAEETNSLRRRLLSAAAAVKVPVKEMESYAKTLADNSIGYDVIAESAGFAAQAVQGLGISGAEAADLLSVLVNRGADVDTFRQKLNNLAEIDDRLQGMGLAEFTRNLPRLMELSGTSVDNIEDLYLAILTLNNGANNKQAVAQYASAMQDFASFETRDKLQKFFHLDTKSNGELKSFSEIMEALTAQADKIGDYERFGKVIGLSENTILAMKQYNNHFQETIDKAGKLGDTSNAVSKRAEQNAKTLKSALTGLQNAVLAQADSALTRPIEKLAELLNEHPEGLEKAIKGAGIALAALSTIKIGSTIVSLVANLKGLRSGVKLDMSSLAGAGGAGIPVYVTNMAGGLSGSGIPGLPVSGLPKAAPAGVASVLSKAVPYAAAAAGVIILSQAIDKAATEQYQIDGKQWAEWDRQAEYTGLFGDKKAALEARIAQLKIEIPEYEKLRAGFGADEQFQHVGFSGEYEMVTLEDLRARLDGLQDEIAALNTGNAQAVNDLIITPQGRFNTHPDDYIFAMKNPATLFNADMPDGIRNEVQSIERVSPVIPPVVVDGEIALRSELVIDDKGYRLRQSVGKNTTPYKFAVGNAQNARVI